MNKKIISIIMISAICFPIPGYAWFGILKALRFPVFKSSATVASSYTTRAAASLPQTGACTTAKGFTYGRSKVQPSNSGRRAAYPDYHRPRKHSVEADAAKDLIDFGMDVVDFASSAPDDGQTVSSPARTNEAFHCRIQYRTDAVEAIGRGIYKWTDEKGIASYGDRVSAGYSKSETVRALKSGSERGSVSDAFCWNQFGFAVGNRTH